MRHTFRRRSTYRWAAAAVAMVAVAASASIGTNARHIPAALDPVPYGPLSPVASQSVTGPATPPPLMPARPNCAVDACVALTFDDGPDRRTTSRLLDILQQKGATATFFIVGNRIAGNEDILERMTQLGMQVENHTWDHPNLTHLAQDSAVYQIKTTTDAISRTTGRAPRYLRPPAGSWLPGVTPTDGLTVALWDVDPLDWMYRDRTTVIANTLSAVKPQSIILLHDIYPTTIDAVPGILDGLKLRGLTPATLDDLLNSTDG